MAMATRQWALAGVILVAGARVAEGQQGDVVRARPVVAARANVNATSGDGMTPLHLAAERGDAVMAEALIKQGANLKATTRLGAYTPLHVASRKGQAGVMRALLKAGSDPNVLSGSGATPLHLAAASGNAEAVRALIDAKADVNALEKEWGQTPLMFAAAADRAAVIKTLLAAKADPSIRTRTVDLAAEEAREAAATRKRNETLLALLPEKTRDSIKAAQVAAAAAAAAQRPGGPPRPAAAARPDSANAAAPNAAATPAPAPFGPRAGMEAPPTNALTATQIQQAIAAGRAALTEKASGPLAAVAEDTSDGQVAGFAKTVGNMGGLSALHHAARQGNMAAALALMDGGADLNLVSGSDSTTPLLQAIFSGHFDLAMQMIARGSNVNIANNTGAAPLYSTINTAYLPRSRYPQPQAVQVQKTSHIELMEALLAKGADVNVRLKKNLWFFGYNNCGNGNCGLEYLDGTTPFWRAAYALDVEAMQLLKKHGADHTIPSFRQVAARAPRGNPAAATGAPPADSATRARAAAAPARPAFAGGGFDGPPVRLSPEMDSASKAVPPGIGVYPIHTAAGVGYGNGFAGNAHRHAPEGWMPTLKYLVEELGADVNQRDNNGYTAMHHAAARGDNEMILYLVSKGGDVKAVARNGRTTVDMANGPVQRLRPFPETIALLEKLGAKNNHRCVAC